MGDRLEIEQPRDSISFFIIAARSRSWELLG
jgi:hypothetical protein